MLLYSLLHLTGYDLSLDDIKQFRQWGSKTPGHPGARPSRRASRSRPGRSARASATRSAWRSPKRTWPRATTAPASTIVDHCTYAIVSDGDLMEGVASEAASLAGHLRLGKLIYLYDDNRVTLSAGTDITFTEDRARRFEAYGWHTQSVDDGNDVAAIDAALRAARAETARPSLILVRTHLGYGSPNKQDSFEAHGSPLGVDEVRLTKQNLGWPVEPAFLVPDAALAHFREALARGARDEAEWNERMRRVRASVSRSGAGAAASACAASLPPGWDADIPVFPADAKGMATRVASGKVMNAIAPRAAGADRRLGRPRSVDVHRAARAWATSIRPARARRDRQGSDGGGWSYAGRNLHFGVREHAMGAIVNGLAAHGGIVPYGATFLIFSDYMRPPIRLAALMGLHVDPRVHARQHCARRGRPDAPAGRAARRPARDSEPHRDPPRRRQRDRGRLARRARNARPAGGCWC